MSTLSRQQIDQIVKGHHWDPLAVLGLHPSSLNGSPAVVIRCFQPDAREAAVVLDEHPKSAIPMSRVHKAGLFEAVLPKAPSSVHYRLRLTDETGRTSEQYDPYAFAPLLTDFELHLFAEGTFFRAYDTLGSHLRSVDGIAGIHFVLWAPNAARVSVVGDFNRWDGRRHPMTSRGAT